MCGESWHAIKDSLTHHPSSQGWAPGVLPTVYMCKYCLSHICIWIEGCVVDGNFFLYFFLSFLSFLASML